MRREIQIDLSGKKYDHKTLTNRQWMEKMNGTNSNKRTLIFLALSHLLLQACSDTKTDASASSDTSEPAPEIPSRPPTAGELLVSQLYTSGAEPAGGTDHYYSDQFIELVNASDAPLDLSGIRIANVYGSAGAINPGMQPDSYRDEEPDSVVMSSVWRISTESRLEPGEALLIAHDGANHRPFSDIDLSGAGFEAYVSGSDRDEDSPTVPNLESLVYNGGYDWLMTVFGPSVVVLDSDTPLDEIAGPFGSLPMVSADAVLDGVDTLMDPDSGTFKRLPDSVDSGFASADGPYTGTALHRQRVDGVWQDTNDSSADFIVGTPEPTLPTETDGIFGDPWLELGTGTSSFVSLSDGDTVELVHGPQGGWHVDATLSFGGFGPAGVTVSYEAVNSDADRVSFVTRAEFFEANVLEADEGWERVGDRIVFDIATDSQVIDTELILRVTAAHGDQTWSDERRVLVVDEE